ncbi:MAG: hypothetical protein KDD51_06515 [Bdellovibrionales bacterium]|nr:hypothetical protein [Bdellovibrionales bacterium]
MKTLSYEFLEPGYKVLVVHRRLYAEDSPRFFVGTVDAFNENSGLLRVTGHSFAPNDGGELMRKPQPRTKVLALTSGTMIVYILPMDTDLARLQVKRDPTGRDRLTDGKAFSLDVSEPGPDL